MPLSLRRAWDAAWAGTCDPLVFAIVRVGLAALVLLRLSDWTAPLLSLDHHAWVHGLDHAPWTDPVRSPAMHAPLIPGLPAVGSSIAGALALARPVLAVALLVGLRPRAAALALGLVGYAAMALDTARYFHHLHLLWISCAWLALTPCDARLSVERWLPGWLRERPAPPRTVAPRWPLVLLRWQALVAYAAAGLAKLEPAWLDGTALARVGEVYPFGGPFWDAGHASIGPSGMAITIAIWELALVPLLAWPRSRVVGVVLGVALHVVLDATTLVSTFGATMILYLITFLPWDRPDGLFGVPRGSEALLSSSPPG